MTVLYIIITIVGFVAGVLGIIEFIFKWKKLLRIAKNFFLVKILNRKPMLFDLKLVSKYNEEPTDNLNFDLFRKIIDQFDKNTESVSKKALRPESMKILIKNLSKGTIYELVIRLDEELKSESLIQEESEILHYNLIIKLSYPKNFNWHDLKHVKDLIRYFTNIDLIIRSNIFDNYKLNQQFFTCYIERQFYIEEKPFLKDDNIRNIRIRIEKNNINITSSNIGLLEDLIRKYYLK